MNISLIIIAIALFAVVYFNKRRFGLLALALVAGSIISASWTSFATITLQAQGFKLLSPPLNMVVGVALLLLPPVILLFVGPTYRKKWQRVAGSVLFAVFGLLLIVSVMQREASALIGDNQVASLTTQYYPFIIVVGVAIAIIDTVHTHLSAKNKKHAD